MHTLSIVIPTYNSEKVIERCLSSILSQTFTDYKIIIQDGLSSDKTLELVKKIQEEFQTNCIIFYSESDVGVYDAMNRALTKVESKWVYFLGSDDNLESCDILEKVFGRSEIENYNVLYGNVKIIGDTSWAKDGSIYDGIFNTKKLLNKNICHQAVFYKRSFIEEIGAYNIKYKLCADWDYNLRCWAATDFLYIDEIIASFHAGGESTKANLDIPFKNDFLVNILSYFKISAFDDLVNSNQFHLFREVKELQRNKFYFKYITKRLKFRLKQFIYGA